MAIKKLFCFPKNIILEEYRQLFSFQMKNQLKLMQCKNKAMDKDRTQPCGFDNNVFLCALGRQFGLIEFLHSDDAASHCECKGGIAAAAAQAAR